MHNLPPFDAEQLRAWRDRMGFSQYRAAEAIGCSRSAFMRWESGRMEIPAYIALACSAVALGVLPHGVPLHKPESRPEIATDELDGMGNRLDGTAPEAA